MRSPAVSGPVRMRSHFVLLVPDASAVSLALIVEPVEALLRIDVLHLVPFVHK